MENGYSAQKATILAVTLMRVEKRILFLVSAMNLGGAQRVAALLCNHWAAQGHQVTLMPTFSGRGECLYPLDERVSLEYLADRVGCTSKSLLNMVRRLLVLRRAIREIQPVVVVSFLSNVNVTALLASRGLGVPVVVAERTFPPAMPLGSLLEGLRRLTYPWATGVVMQTQQGNRWLKTCCPKATGYVIANPVVYPLPVAEPIVEPATVLGESRRVLLAVGRLCPEKGFNNLLEAFASLAGRFPDWNVIILGEGFERESLEKQRHALGLDGRVYLPGRVGNLADWYQSADLYVMSSRFEGFPNTLLEAMAHGLPAVSIDCETGPRDIIRHETDGLLVAPQSGSAGLAQALALLMNNNATRARMAEAAVTLRERFAIAGIVRQWDDVLGLAG